MRKYHKLITVAAIAASLTFNGIASADAIWDRWQAADAAVARGDEAGAVPHWQFLVDHYASLGEWHSAALFSGRLNSYYDKVKDYDNAIKYYELENEYWLKDGKDWGAVDVQRAEQIRTTIELYLTNTPKDSIVKAAAPKTGSLAKLEPEYGSYFGIYSEQDPLMGNMFTKSESVYGRKHSIYLAYDQYGNKFPKGYTDRVKQAGGAFQLGWEPSQGLDKVNDDAYLRQWAREAKASGVPIFLRFACEMNGDWVVWHGDPQKYIEKFRTVAKVMKEEAPNVAMVWSPGDVPAYSMHQYYPGDEYVDWVGVSLYVEPYSNGDKADPMLATSPVERLDELYRTYADRKPLMLSETGVPHTFQKTEDFTEWAILNLSRLYDVMPYKYPRLKAITYFNVDMATKGSNSNNYRISANQPVMDVYKKLIANPYFISKVENGAKPTTGVGFTEADSNASFSRNTHIVPFIKIPDVYIGKVDYLLNGELIKSQTQLPFGFDLDAGSVSAPSQMEIRVYNKENSQVASKKFPLSSQVSMVIDGKEPAFEQPPVIRNGNTLAPVRAVLEAMGAKVSWDDETRTVTAQRGSTTITMKIGQNFMMKGNEKVNLEEPAQLVGNYTMIPARAAGEAFGGAVSWDAKTRTVTVTNSVNKSASTATSIPTSISVMKEKLGFAKWIKSVAISIKDKVTAWI